MRRLLNPYVLWVILALVQVWYTAEAIYTADWWGLCAPLIAIVACALGIGTARQIEHRLKWNARMLDAQEQQLKFMRTRGRT